MQVLFICAAILMAIAALILLVIAAMSTGSTRKELYRYAFHSVFLSLNICHFIKACYFCVLENSEHIHTFAHC